ncbi:unnamed protein product [Didymodactylos carnosus]|uniref:Uncharacterized protein n=1 Tax=Didymodactylos carnosus TaxID=1234261 RepID=A0A814BV94_9BILA|nr:unnamed protein product [Didymodactylos carnosus]CAF1180081.1 unnamed protein product [Didymodactylos carnosus]CAF3710873.1 unnamed protein product [Didymodactylos carnosus]CAF3991369.1 unnamed protein product [Didymodactylos carnosus]
MITQHNEYNSGGEIAIWLLITVGALLVPIIVIAICCIRRHLLKNPPVKLMEDRTTTTTTMNKSAVTGLRTYSGPYSGSHEKTDSIVSTPKQNCNTNLSSINNLDSLSKNGSLKKQHVHWPDGRSIISPKQDCNNETLNINNNNNDISNRSSDFILNDLRTIKNKQFSPKKQLCPLNTEHLYENGGIILNITNFDSLLTRPNLPTVPSTLSYLIQSAVLPISSTLAGRTLIN